MKMYKGLKTKSKTKNTSQIYGVEGDLTTQSRTQQEFKDEVNINKIVEKYRRTGMLRSSNAVRQTEPMYGDFTAYDYIDNQRKMAVIKNQFSNIPPEERAKHNNDPAVWLDAKITAQNDAIAAAEAKKQEEMILNQFSGQTEPLKETTEEKP